MVDSRRPGHICCTRCSLTLFSTKKSFQVFIDQYTMIHWYIDASIQFTVSIYRLKHSIIILFLSYVTSDSNQLRNTKLPNRTYKRNTVGLLESYKFCKWTKKEVWGNSFHWWCLRSHTRLLFLCRGIITFSMSTLHVKSVWPIVIVLPNRTYKSMVGYLFSRATNFANALKRKFKETFFTNLHWWCLHSQTRLLLSLSV